MSKISIEIGPKSYPFVCGDGEEDHIRKLAAIIDEKYSQLGSARTPQEAQNILFAALFLADELAEARKSSAKSDDKVNPGDRTEDLHARIDTLTKAEARARAENEALKAQLEQMREAASYQHDMFGDVSEQEGLAKRLEALADHVEETASTLEADASAS